MKSNKVFELNKYRNLNYDNFTTKYLEKKKPVIISGEINWPALKKWNPSFLKELYPNKEVTLTIFAPEINMPGTELKLNIPDAVDLICNNLDESKRYYLMQKSLQNEFPELLSDIDIPKYADVTNEHTINFWFGQEKVNTKPHYDYSNNFLVQIVGRKRVRMFAPDNTPYMYPYSMYNCVTMNGIHHPAVQASQISDTDFLISNDFPDFKMASCFEGILNPGDLLYIPAGWWHEVKSLDVSMSVNFWWKIGIENFPNEQLTKVVCSYFHWYEDLFHEKIRLAFDFSDFQNDLQIAEFALSKNLKCVCAIFILSYLNTRKKDSCYEANFCEWSRELAMAKDGNEISLQGINLQKIIHKIKVCENNIKLEKN